MGFGYNHKKRDKNPRLNISFKNPDTQLIIKFQEKHEQKTLVGAVSMKQT